MTKWNPLVNQNFYIDGDYGHSGDGILTLKFESGKDRTLLKNSYIPIEYSSVILVLDNINAIARGTDNTEYKQFVKWYEEESRYGTVPFIYKDDLFIYSMKFTSIPKYDGFGQVMASFGIRIEHKEQYNFVLEENLLITEERKYIIPENGRRIRIEEESC